MIAKVALLAAGSVLVVTVEDGFIGLHRSLQGQKISMERVWQLLASFKHLMGGGSPYPQVGLPSDFKP